MKKNKLIKAKRKYTKRKNKVLKPGTYTLMTSTREIPSRKNILPDPREMAEIFKNMIRKELKRSTRSIIKTCKPKLGKGRKPAAGAVKKSLKLKFKVKVDGVKAIKKELKAFTAMSKTLIKIVGKRRFDAFQPAQAIPMGEHIPTKGELRHQRAIEKKQAKAAAKEIKRQAREQARTEKKAAREAVKQAKRDARAAKKAARLQAKLAKKQARLDKKASKQLKKQFKFSGTASTISDKVNLSSLAMQLNESSRESRVREVHSPAELVAQLNSKVSAVLHAITTSDNVLDMIESTYVDADGTRLDSARPEGVPIAMADLIIQALDFCGQYGIDIHTALQVKAQYDQLRPRKQNKK